MLDAERLPVHRCVQLELQIERADSTNRLLDPVFLRRLRQDSRACSDQRVAEHIEVARVLDLEADVIHAGAIAGQQLNLMVLLVARQRDRAVRVHGPAQPQDVAQEGRRALGIRCAQRQMAHVHPHGRESARRRAVTSSFASR